MPSRKVAVSDRDGRSGSPAPGHGGREETAADHSRDGQGDGSTGAAPPSLRAGADVALPARAPAPRGGLGSTLSARIADRVATDLASPLAPGLYIVATPIGNLGDVTLRALTTLARVDVVYCEDTRHSSRLLAHYGLSPRLESYHDHNGSSARPRILARLAAGQRIALVSDAGTPLVSDPGYKLVRAVVEAGHAVTSLPGPSAAIAALTLAGLPTDAFTFLGFLPPKSAARRARLQAEAGRDDTILVYEAAHRVGALLADVVASLGDRPVVVARELTKLHEEVRRGCASDLAAAVADMDLKGECVVLIGAAAPGGGATDDDIRSALAALPDETHVKDAARAVADRLGVPRSRVYDIALAVRRAAGTHAAAGETERRL